ncbi:MAG: ribosomal protein S18-alanine N-acetyltransferase [Anaerolineae bacterium]
MIDYTELPVRIEPMRVEDIGAVLAIEHQSFSSPWSARAYDYELRYNDMAHYFVARWQEASAGAVLARHGWNPFNWLESLLHPAAPPADFPIIGYVGFWLMAGEVHISTIAVSPEYRGRNIGELILATAIDRAMELHATEATLEVRLSNTVAQDLYLKYGFAKVGMRKGYYQDNNEDAIIMTTPPFSAPEYQVKFQRLKDTLLYTLRDAESSYGKRGRARIRGGSTYG